MELLPLAGELLHRDAEFIGLHTADDVLCFGIELLFGRRERGLVDQRLGAADRGRRILRQPLGELSCRRLQISRWNNRDEIDSHLRQWTRECDHLELAATLQKAGVPAGPVLDSVELHEDRHLWEWGYWWKMNHREVGERVLPGMPVKMSNVAEFNYSYPPDLGEHNREVFGGLLGLSDAEIKKLIEEKVIY